MHKNMDLLMLKDKFQQKLLNLTAYVRLIFTYCVDVNVEL